MRATILKEHLQCLWCFLKNIVRSPRREGMKRMPVQGSASKKIYHILTKTLRVRKQQRIHDLYRKKNILYHSASVLRRNPLLYVAGRRKKRLHFFYHVLSKISVCITSWFFLSKKKTFTQHFLTFLYIYIIKKKERDNTQETIN